MMKLALALLLLAACGGDKPAPAQPVANQTTEPASPPPAAKSDPDAQRAKAQQEADDASKAADEARAKVDKITAEMNELNKRVEAVVNAVVQAQNDADRSAANAKLKQLQIEKREMDARMAEAKAAAMRAERNKGVKISPACVDNPLAKGC